MHRTVKFTRLFAVLTLLTWFNVQAMACCWVIPDHDSLNKAEVAIPMAEDHSCCPGGKAQSVPNEPASSQASSEDCGMDQHGATALCCNHTDPAEVSAFSPQFSFVQLAFVAYRLPAFSEKRPEAVSPPPSHASSGSPRYLALERILI